MTPSRDGRALGRGVLVAVLAALAGCQGSGATGVSPYPVGATSFESFPPGGARGSAMAGAPGPVASPDAAPASGAGVARAIEEADIYQRSGPTLFVLNAYRGLQVVDLADPSAPRLLSRVPVLGTPVDLYLRASTAFVAVSDFLAYRVADGETQPERGSRLVAVDVADPLHPRTVAELPLDGEVLQTRLVGDVLYVVSRQATWYAWPGYAVAGAGTAVAGVGTAAPGGAVAGGGWDSVSVASFDVRDPAHPLAVDRLELPASGWDVHAHVTAERVTLSFAGWSDAGPVTRFRVIDISDAGGALVAGTELACAGVVRDRWSMDYDGATGLFRAVVAAGWGNAGAALQIWSSPKPDAAEVLSRLGIDVAEALTAARFDGDRVYVVTARRTDPLWAVDASDPRQPRLAGSLAMPGQLDFIEPRGQRLLALGHTDEAGQPWQLAVTLLDVSDLALPKPLKRETFGAGAGWVAATADDLRKAFIVLEPAAGAPGLVLVPVQGWDPTAWRYQGGTQLLDWTPDTLTLRGFLAHPGAVKRSVPVDAAASRLVALSDAALQTVDASNRDAPVELARLDLARPVTTLALIRGHAVELSGDWYRGDMELAVTPALDPDAAVPLARVPVAAPGATLLQDGDLVWLLGVDAASGRAWLEGHDFADPAHPRARGRIELAASEVAGATGPGMLPAYGFAGEAVLVGHAVVVHRPGWPCPGLCGSDGGATGLLHVYDVADPDQPRLASTVEVGAGWSWGLRAVGAFAWLTHFEWDGTSERGRYYLDRVDLTDPARPSLWPKVNVPGVFFGASADGQRIVTLESWWKDGASASFVHRLTLRGGAASLDGSAALAGQPSGAELAGDVAYVATAWWDAAGGGARLYAIDVAPVSVASEQKLGGAGASLRRVAGGKLFLQSSWGDPGLLVYGLSDPRHPALEQLFRTESYPWDVVVGGGYAYLPSGAYGVPMVKLAP